MNSVWNDAYNAQLYEQYAQTFATYKETGKKMLEIAEIHPGFTVIDVACGTGIVTEQIVARLAGQGTFIGVDMSEAMLAIARRKLPQVQFIQVYAGQLHEVVPEGTADIVICNSAFWQWIKLICGVIKHEVIQISGVTTL